MNKSSSPEPSHYTISRLANKLGWDEKELIISAILEEIQFSVISELWEIEYSEWTDLDKRGYSTFISSTVVRKTREVRHGQRKWVLPNTLPKEL
jgi:hypothetical protein